MAADIPGGRREKRLAEHLATNNKGTPRKKGNRNANKRHDMKSRDGMGQTWVDTRFRKKKEKEDE